MNVVICAVGDDDGLGAHMDDKGWQALKRALEGRNPELKKLSKHTAPNMHALVGAETSAELIEAAGGLGCLAKMLSSWVSR